MKKKLYPLEKFSLNFGISTSYMLFLSQRMGSNPKNFRFKLKRIQNSFVRKHFDLEFFSTYKSKISKRLHFFWNIKIYKGIRHMLRLPSRGQRTHTNGRTKRKFKL